MFAVQTTLLIGGYIRIQCGLPESCVDLTKMIALFYDYPVREWRIDERKLTLSRRSKPLLAPIFKQNNCKFQLKMYPMGVNKPHKQFLMIAFKALSLGFSSVIVYLELIINGTNYYFKGRFSFFW
eukprot:157992_1